ncbi:PAS domain-containing protein [uncultured Desulfosarcina sp.]|uniref:PAS domain-containing protein n=1 Tax=uncultured Desulfosarcina sp. TaxID=218289 RepID=UPI0029C949C7|nr:PAS domain-containing protein [uncultured Desulfosarcina sp.]
MEALVRGAPPVERFSYQFFCYPDVDEANLKGCRVIVLDFENDKPISLEKILAAKDEQTVVIGCFSADSFPAMAESYQHFDQIWVKPFAEEKVRSSFKRILERLKEQEDLVLTQKYLDTLIDSLPDLIWFKDAKGAHLKVNNSFCRAVNKTKAQVEGRGHYYIWDLEPDEYAQGEFICLESEEIVLNKKETCLFDETVKCGNELRKFKTYKSPIFDTDGSVIGTVGFAHDVTNLQNLLIELNILVESLPFAVMITDKDRTITSVNHRFTDNFILDRAEVIGMSVDSLLDETMPLTRSKRWTVERGKEGTLLLSEDRALKILEEKLLDVFGILAGYIQIFMDVTFEHQLLEEKKKLEKALAEIKKLSGMLPICASCKKIRDDQGYWTQIESYISKHSDTQFSHGICPDCAKKLYGDLYQESASGRGASKTDDDGS